VYETVGELFPAAEARTHRLKGLSQPVRAYSLGSAARAAV
jgi:class 3 adenylate cyclase